MSHQLVRYLCILLLLFAQQAAYTHAAWHAGEQAAGHERQHDASFEDKLCDLHGVFAEVLGAMPCSGAQLPGVSSHDAQTPAIRTAWLVLPCPLPPSRGPPSLC